MITDFIIPLSFTLLISLFFGKICEKLGFRWHLLDCPKSEPHKCHNQEIPSLGGLAMGLSWLTIGGGIYLLSYFHLWSFKELKFLSQTSQNPPYQWGCVCLGGCVLWILGLLDDRYHLSARIKFSGQMIASLCVLLGGITFHLTGLLWLDGVLTFFWILLICNALNFLDNMNGLAGGIAFLISLGFIFLATFSQRGDLLVLGSFFCAGLCGFMYYNFPQARLFMGDAGSLILGYFLAILSLSLQQTLRVNLHPLSSFILVLTPLLVPIIDLFATVFIRLVEQRPIYRGDNAHISHRFCDLGFTRIQSVICILCLTLWCVLCCILTIFMTVVGFFLCFAMAFCVVFIVCFYQIFRRFCNSRFNKK